MNIWSWWQYKWQWRHKVGLDADEVPDMRGDLHCHHGMYRPFLKCSQNHHHHQLSSLSLSSSKHFLDDTIVFTLFVAGTDLPSNEGLAWVPLKSGISVAAWASASAIGEKSFNQGFHFPFEDVMLSDEFSIFSSFLKFLIWKWFWETVSQMSEPGIHILFLQILSFLDVALVKISNIEI